MAPWHIELGFFNFYFYEGIYFVIAIALGVVVGRKLMQQGQVTVEKYDYLILWALIVAFIGARLSHFLFWNWNVLSQNPLVFFTSPGGFSITGGLYGGFLGAYIYCKRNDIDFWRGFAFISPAVLLAQGLGRIGCFLNGDAWGTETSLPWGLEYPRYGTSVPSGTLNTSISSPSWRWAFENNLVEADSIKTVPLHPTQLYEAFFDFALMIGIYFLVKSMDKQKKSLKMIFWIHAGGYALFRYLVEYIKGDREQVIFLNTSVVQWALLIFALVSVVKIIQEVATLNKSTKNP